MLVLYHLCAISSVVERFIDIEEADSSILSSRTDAKQKPPVFKDWWFLFLVTALRQLRRLCETERCEPANRESGEKVTRCHFTRPCLLF